MSALSYALSQTYSTIDKSLLDQAFVNNSEAAKSCPLTNLDSLILENVYYKRMSMDINLIGGREIHLCTSHGQLIHQDAYGSAFHFSDEALHGNPIVAALAFFPGLSCINGVLPNSPCALAGSQFPPELTGMLTQTQTLQSLTNRLNQVNVGGPQAIVTPRIVAHNTILLDMLPALIPQGIFKVIISHDSGLNDLNPRTWPFFAKLFLAATKAYIYQVHRSKLLRGATFYGQEYGIYAELVNAFSEAEPEYQALLHTWGKVSRMNDKPRHNALIKLQTRPF